MSYRTNGFRRSILCGLCFLVCLGLSVFAQNDRRQNVLKQVKNGGFIENWLVSSVLPAEIDAGTWENFNRFNIENLPQKDWLAPFGGIAGINPQIGTQKAGFK